MRVAGTILRFRLNLDAVNGTGNRADSSGNVEQALAASSVPDSVSVLGILKESLCRGRLLKESAGHRLRHAVFTNHQNHRTRRDKHGVQKIPGRTPFRLAIGGFPEKSEFWSARELCTPRRQTCADAL